jgi:hypothetical protein
MRGTQLQSGIDPRDLVDLATIGANYMVKGAVKFEAWSERMLANAGDVLNWLAAQTQRTLDSILREIHSYAAKVAARFGVEAEPAPAEAPREEGLVRIVPANLHGGAAEDAGAFVLYRPSIQGSGHKGILVETQTMASVPLPPLTYQPDLPQALLDSGDLSAAQMEAIVLAGQANETILADGSRGAALIGDGTGVGKGRIIAGIALDNWNKGRRRIVWVTDNWRLIEDARCDLMGIGAFALASSIKPADKYEYGVPIGHQGVLFAPYSWLRSHDRRQRARIDQLIRYARGEDGGEGAVVLFDESHNLKNTVGRSASDTGKAVAKLLEKVPKLRTTFLSATAATDLGNMGYLSRLGLWGPKTPFPQGFSEFQTQLGRGGMSAMELLARELKALGRYLSRTISYKGVVLRPDVIHPLNEDQKAIYRSAAKAWRDLQGMIDDALAVTNAGSKAKVDFMNLYWGAQQRFFNVLLTAMKAPTAVAEAQKALAEGHSVVISLINTNEATQKRQEAKMRAAEAAGEEIEQDQLDFGPGEILTELVQTYFPVAQYVDAIDPVTNKPTKVKLKKPDGSPVRNPEAVRMRDELIAKLRRELKLPANPLDLLIEGLGGRSQVAELTGREKVVDPATGKFVPRGEKGTPREKVNIVEAEAFQQGKKRIAVISNAASTGISLHADNTKQNRQKRIHITLQVGWSADKAMQMLGRSHRTNQAHAPEYAMVASDLGGEKRFISTIAQRLGSLGALTKGSREAAGANADAIAKVNFNTTEGLRAADAFYSYLLKDPQVGDTTGLAILDQMGVLHKDKNNGQVSVLQDNRQNVNRLLNRLLSLDPDVQNAAYDLFYDYFEQAVARALETGTLDVGVRQLFGERPRIVERNVLATDDQTGAETIHYVVETQVRQQRTSPAELEQLARRHKDGRLYRVGGRGGEERVVFAWPAPDIVHANGRIEKAFYVVRPDRGRQKVAESAFRGEPLAEYIPRRRREIEGEIKRRRDDLEFHRGLHERHGRYSVEVEREQAQLDAAEEELAALGAAGDSEAAGRRRWQETFEATPEFSPERHNLLGGTVLKWWGHIQDAGVQGIFSAQDHETGERIVGVEVAAGGFRSLVDRIAGGRSAVTPRQVWSDVLDNGTPYELAHGVRLTRGRVGRNEVIQVHPGNNAQRLIELGVRYERGVIPLHYITTGDAGPAVLGRVLEEFPVETGRGSGERGAVTLDFLTFGAQLIRDGVVKFAEWSKRMVARFGEAVRRHLLPLYYQAKAAAGNFFSDERGSIGGQETGPHGPIFREFAEKPKQALEWLRQQKTGFAADAIPHAELGAIGLAYGQPGDPANEFRGGYGVSHIDAKHPGYLDENIERITGLPIVERFKDSSGRLTAVVLSDGKHRAVVSRDWMGKPTETWLLTAYERPASAASVSVREAQRGAGPTPPATDRTSIIGRKSDFEKSPDYHSAVARGAQLLREGVTRFADWSRRMLAEFGERIKPYLTRLYYEAKKLWQDTRGSSSIEIDAIEAAMRRVARLRNPARALGQAIGKSVVAEGLDILAAPLESRMEREGRGAGKPLMAALRRAGDLGEVSAGQRLARLLDAKLNKLTKQQRWNLLDVLEGRDDAMDNAVDQAYRVVRELTGEMADEAEDLDVMVRYSSGRRKAFERLENYFPHLIRNVEALKSGPVRKDVLENLVRLGIRPDRASAESFLDEYIAFVEGGGHARQLIAHLVATRQAAARRAGGNAAAPRPRRHRAAPRSAALRHPPARHPPAGERPAARGRAGSAGRSRSAGRAEGLQVRTPSHRRGRQVASKRRRLPHPRGSGEGGPGEVLGLDDGRGLPRRRVRRGTQLQLGRRERLDQGSSRRRLNRPPRPPARRGSC